MLMLIETYRSYILGSVALCALLALVSCGEGTVSTASDAYKTLCVKRQDFTQMRQFMSNIESKENINVNALIGGTLKTVCVKEGARVKKGQPLFIIDQAPYIAAVNAAKAQVGTAHSLRHN